MKRPACTHVFENNLSPNAAVQQTQHVDKAGCRTCVSGMISVCLWYFANS